MCYTFHQPSVFTSQLYSWPNCRYSGRIAIQLDEKCKNMDRCLWIILIWKICSNCTKAGREMYENRKEKIIPGFINCSVVKWTNHTRSSIENHFRPLFTFCSNIDFCLDLKPFGWQYRETRTQQRAVSVVDARPTDS